MKATAIVRRIDPQGRVVLPTELRKTLNIYLGDPLEFFADEDAIILKKYSKQCVLCGSMEDMRVYKGKSICVKCIEELK